MIKNTPDQCAEHAVEGVKFARRGSVRTGYLLLP